MLLRGGVYPMQFFPALAGRRVDIGAGYRMEKGPRESEWQRQGPYAEVGMYPFQSVLSSTYRLRGGALATSELFLLDDHGDRAGFGVAAALELVGFYGGVFDTPEAIGLMYGEWGVGAFAGPGVRLADSGQRWAGTFGVSVRIPFMAGLFCCIDPFSDDTQTRASTSRHKSTWSSGRPTRWEPYSGSE